MMEAAALDHMPYGAHRRVYSRTRDLHRVSEEGGGGATQVTIGEESRAARWRQLAAYMPHGAHRRVYSHTRDLHRVSEEGGGGVTQVTIGEESRAARWR